ncbi:MAG: DUF4291 domain-containing protein [Bacteroidota bacterium]
MPSSHKYEIRATFDQKRIAIYQAFDSSIAEPALQNQKLVSPFSYSRMTWIKPSYLWLMYRSDWANRAGMGRILKIWIYREAWDAALREAVLTTPESHVYKDAKKWRKMLDKASIRVQWDPERDVYNNRLPYKSIQVGITPVLAKAYAREWIDAIEDCTQKTRQIRDLVYARDFSSAKVLLPEETAYPVDGRIKQALGMS